MKVYGNLMNRLLESARPGSLVDVKRTGVVEMIATVSRSDRDEKFGFYSRPSKARIVEVAA